jgi:hypothetical protein
LECINEVISYINKLQQEMGVEQTTILDFNQLVFDNTASNTGCTSGLGALFKQKQLKYYEEAKKLNPNLPELQPLLEKGCSDHITALVSTRFQSKLFDLGVQWNATWITKAWKWKAKVNCTLLV